MIPTSEIRLVDQAVVIPLAQKQLLQSGLETIIAEVNVAQPSTFVNVDLDDPLVALLGHPPNRVKQDGSLSEVRFSSDDELTVEMASKLATGELGAKASKQDSRQYLMETVLPGATVHSHISLYVARVSSFVMARMSTLVPGLTWESHFDTQLHSGMFVYPRELEEWPNQLLLYKDRMQRGFDDYIEVINSLIVQFRREHPNSVLDNATRQRMHRIAGYALPSAAAHHGVVSGSVSALAQVTEVFRNSISAEEATLGEALRRVLRPMAPDLYEAEVDVDA